MPSPSGAVFVDLDRTLLRSASGPVLQEAMVAEVEAAAKDGDSLGGVIEVLAYGTPIGLGSHVHWDRKIDANLAQAIMSIQAVEPVSTTTVSPPRSRNASRLLRSLGSVFDSLRTMRTNDQEGLFIAFRLL